MRRVRTVITGIVLAGALLAGTIRTRADDSEPAAKIRLGDLSWDRKSIATFDGSLLGERAHPVRVKLATLANPMRYKADLAFYKLASALGTDLVPRTWVRAVPLGELLASLAKDPAGAVIVRRDVSVRNDATVMTTVSDVVPRTVDVVPAAGTWSEPLRAWAEARAPVPEESRGLAGAYVQMLVLDYLAGNVSRAMTAFDPAANTLCLVDNRGAFADRPDATSLDIGLARLKRVARFPRRFVAALRGFDQNAAAALLRAGAFSDWLLAPRAISEMLERRRAVLSLVDARILQSGENETLSLP